MARFIYLKTSRRLSLSKAKAVKGEDRYGFDRLSLRLLVIQTNEMNPLKIDVGATLVVAQI